MYALEHLEGVQGRRGLVAPPEKSVLASVDMRMEVFGSLVHYALEKVTFIPSKYTFSSDLNFNTNLS